MKLRVNTALAMSAYDTNKNKIDSLINVNLDMNNINEV